MLRHAVRPVSAARLPFAIRGLCAEAATRKKNACILLGVQPGATPNEIKKAYFMLAKKTHPDVIAREAKEAAEREKANAHMPKIENFQKGSSGVLSTDHAAAAAKPTVVPFLEVQAAYDILMAEDTHEADAKRARTAKAGARPARAPTLGEVLCDRLRDEPEAYDDLWQVSVTGESLFSTLCNPTDAACVSSQDIVRDKLRVTEQMLEALLKAIRKTAKPGAKVDAARVGTYLIHDGTYHGVLNIDTRCSAFVSLLNWCQAEEDELGDVALEIIDQITDEDRAHSPAVMAAIGSVFCSGTRSPY